MYTVRILWGSPEYLLDNDADPNTYTFETEEELGAFLEGVEAALAWNGFTILEDGDVPTKEEVGSDLVVTDASGNRTLREISYL
jgi:hypothetical protein